MNRSRWHLAIGILLAIAVLAIVLWPARRGVLPSPLVSPTAPSDGPATTQSPTRVDAAVMEEVFKQAESSLLAAGWSDDDAREIGSTFTELIQVWSGEDVNATIGRLRAMGLRPSATEQETRYIKREWRGMQASARPRGWETATDARWISFIDTATADDLARLHVGTRGVIRSIEHREIVAPDASTPLAQAALRQHIERVATSIGYPLSEMRFATFGGLYSHPDVLPGDRAALIVAGETRDGRRFVYAILFGRVPSGAWVPTLVTGGSTKSPTDPKADVFVPTL